MKPSAPKQNQPENDQEEYVIMKTILINGNPVRVGAETLRRIERVAEKMKISLPEAISFCLQKVI